MSVDELKQFGLVEMSEPEINDFLTNQGVGVLGLPTANAPYLVPMSFGYDGGAAIYFTYLLGEHSEKEDLTEAAERARFLVFNSRSMYHWQSVLLTGTLTKIPEEQWDDIQETLINAWYPEVLESAELSRGMAIYRFAIEEVNGIKHSGLPPGFQTDGDQ